MTFSESIRTCIVKATTFEGRARRSEFWFFYLFVTLGGLMAYVVDFILFWPPLDQMGARLSEAFADPLSIYAQLLPVTSFWFFLTILPLVAVGVRRMHDRDKPGLWFLGLYALLIGFSVLTMAVFGDDMGEMMRLALNPRGMTLADADRIDEINSRITVFSGMQTLVMAAMIILLASNGTKGPNSYGQEPQS